MTKPNLKVIPGGKVDLIEAPEEHEFACPVCGRSCKLYPKSKPLAVVHAEPRRACSAWRSIEDRKGDLAQFLIKAGVHLLLPQHDPN